MNEEPKSPAVVNERRGATSASAAPYDALCPGRHNAQRGLSEPESGDASFGNAIHAALATDDPSSLNGPQLNIYESAVEIREKIISDVFGPDAAKVVRFKEQRYWCMVQRKWEHSAKPDLICRHGAVGLIIEYKTLPGDVADSPQNLQLRDQVVLSARSLILSEVFVAIVQPLVSHNPDLCRYDAAAITLAETEMFARVEASNHPDALRKAGEVQCRFCLARHTCPEHRAMVALAAPTEPLAALAAINVTDWTPMQRTAFCERKAVALKWIDECSKQLKALLEADPAAIPGWALSPGSIKRPVRDVAELHDRFLAAGGTTKHFLSCLDLGKGDFEKAVREITKLKGKALAGKINDLLDGLTYEKQDAPSLSRSE